MVGRKALAPAAAEPSRAKGRRQEVPGPVAAPGRLDTAAERRKESQRLRIIQEASRLFEENGGEHGGGFETTTVMMIAERSDISVRTFFRYFECKQDVIYLDYRRSTIDLLRLVHERLSVEPVERAVLNASIEGMRTFLSTRPNRERLIRSFRSPNFVERRAIGQLHTHDRLVEVLVPHLKPAPDPQLRAGLIVTLVRGMLNEALEQWVAAPEQDLVELIERAVSQLPQLASTLAPTPHPK
jgi:AcrR family transcriptional regulator